MTGYGSIDQAVQAMRMGAYDFMPKPVDPEHLRLVVERMLRERTLQDEVLQLREQLQEQYAFRGVLSGNPSMHAVFELIRSVAQTTTTVLIEGETGTGKEQVARAIHEASSSLRSGSVRGHQLRGPAGNAVGKRAVRPRKRLVHRRGWPAQGSLRAGRHRHAVSR